MIAPAVAGQRFLWACLLGAALGLFYDFLRFLRPRWLGDLLFSGGLLWASVYLAFGVCGGETTIWYTAGMLLGGTLWTKTLGKWVRPFFQGLYNRVIRAFSHIFRPIKYIFKKIRKKQKNLFASWGKWGTIKSNNRQSL